MEPSARYPRIYATLSSWRIKIVYSRGLLIRLLVLQTAKNSRIHSSFEAASAPACLMALIARDEVFFSTYEYKRSYLLKYLLLLGEVTKRKNSHITSYPTSFTPSRHQRLCLRSFSTAGGVFRDRRTCLTPRAIDIIFLSSSILK
jgi:hypothetical protein